MLDFLEKIEYNIKIKCGSTTWRLPVLTKIYKNKQVGCMAATGGFYGKDDLRIVCRRRRVSFRI